MRNLTIRGGEAFTRINHPRNEPETEDGPIEFTIATLNMRIDEISCTFGEFWKWLTKDMSQTVLLDRIYSDPMGNFPLSGYINQSKKPFKPSKIEDDDMKFLEIFWGVDLFEGEVEIYPGFHGWGIWHMEGEEDSDGGFAIEFTPLNELLHYPLKINKEFMLSEWNMDDKKVDLYYKGERDFTLHDLVWAVLQEITWSGGEYDDQR